MTSTTVAQETLKQIYANKNLSSFYSIPRKQTGQGCLEAVKEHGREWGEVIRIVHQSVVDRYVMARWKMDSVQLCRNTTLEDRFIRKRQQLKEAGRSAKELTEQYAFHVVSHGKARHVCQNGMTVSAGKSLFTNVLGRSDMGILLKRHADMTLKLAEKLQFSQTFLMVFKIIPGRVKAVPTNFKPLEEAMEPTPNFDCHVSTRLPTVAQKETHQLANSCIFLYEYDDSCCPSKVPCHILPYAVVTCSQVSPVQMMSPVCLMDTSTSSDTDGMCSDMDIVDDSSDEKVQEAKMDVSPSITVSVGAVHEEQASEGDKKLSVTDIQNLDLGQSREGKTCVLDPATSPHENKTSQSANHSTDSATKLERSNTVLKPATFQYGNKESQASNQATVSSADGGTKSQRFKTMAAGFHAKLRDPRIRHRLLTKKFCAYPSVTNGSRNQREKSESPENAQEAETKKGQGISKQSVGQRSNEAYSGVWTGKSNREKEKVQTMVSTKQEQTKDSSSGKHPAVNSCASEHRSKRKHSTKLKKQGIPDKAVTVSGERHISVECQERKEPEVSFKHAEVTSGHKVSQHTLLRVFGTQQKQRHSDDSKKLSDTTAGQHIEELNKTVDTTIEDPLTRKVDSSSSSDSEHTAMLAAVLSLNRSLDHLTPTFDMSPAEMSNASNAISTVSLDEDDSFSDTVSKIKGTELVKRIKDITSGGHGTKSKCLEMMEIPNEDCSSTAEIGFEGNKMCAGDLSLEEGDSHDTHAVPTKMEVALKEDRTQKTDAECEKQSNRVEQPLGKKKLLEGTFLQMAADQDCGTINTDPMDLNSDGKASFAEEKAKHPRSSCGKETDGDTKSTNLVIDQVFSLAEDDIRQVLVEEQEDADRSEEMALFGPKQPTVASDGLSHRPMSEPQVYYQNDVTVSDVQSVICEADNLLTAWKTRENTLLESLLSGVQNTLELGVQTLQAHSTSPQPVAVRTAATLAIRTSATLLDLALEEVRGCVSRQTSLVHHLGQTGQEPTSDGRKLESLISGTINTLRMQSDCTGSCSLQSSLRTALTLLEFALDIVQIRGSAVGQRHLYSESRGGTMYHHKDRQMSGVTGQWTLSGGQADMYQKHHSGERTHPVTVEHEVEHMFSVTTEKQQGSSHMQQATGAGRKASAKPVTPPPLPPPLPTFLSLTPLQIVTVGGKRVAPSPLPSLPPTSLGSDHNGNSIGTWKCEHPKLEDQVDTQIVTPTNPPKHGFKVDSAHNTENGENFSDPDKQGRWLEHCVGTTPDKEENLCWNSQDMTLDHDVESQLEEILEAGTGERQNRTVVEDSVHGKRNEESTPMPNCDVVQLKMSGTEQESELKGKEEISYQMTSTSFLAEDNKAVPESAVSQKGVGVESLSDDPGQSKIQGQSGSFVEPQQMSVKDSEHSSRPLPEPVGKGTDTGATSRKKEAPVCKSEKEDEETKEAGSCHEYLAVQNCEGSEEDCECDGGSRSSNEPSQPSTTVQESLNPFADDDMDQLADDVFLSSDVTDFPSIFNDSSQGFSLMSSGSTWSYDNILLQEDRVVENTPSEGASRAFACFGSHDKDKLNATGKHNEESERICNLTATVDIDPTLANTELSTKEEKVGQEGRRLKDKEACNRARSQWTELSLVSQGEKEKSDREVKTEQQEQLPQVDCQLDSKTALQLDKLKEQNTVESPGSGITHILDNSTLLGARGGSAPADSHRDSGSSTYGYKCEPYETFGMKRHEDRTLKDLGEMTPSSSNKASRISTQMSGGPARPEASFDFDRVLRHARSSHAQEMFNGIVDQMKKVSAEVEHFEQAILHLELDKSSFSGISLKKDQHLLLLRAATIRLSEVRTELEMMHATKTYLSNIRRKQMGRQEKKTPLQEVSSLYNVLEEDSAPPEDREPTSVRNVLLRHLHLMKNQVKALHKNLKSYVLISGNNIEFVRMLLRSQIHTCGCEIKRLEEVLQEEKPSVNIRPDEARIAKAQERKDKCQELLRKLVKDEPPDYGKIEWSRMKCGRYHSILVYEEDKRHLWDHRALSKSRTSSVDAKGNRSGSRGKLPEETRNHSASKTTKRQHKPQGKHGKNVQLSKRRRMDATNHKTLPCEVLSSEGYIKPTAAVGGGFYHLQPGCDEHHRVQEQSSDRPDPPASKRPKLVPAGHANCTNESSEQGLVATRLPSPCDQQQLRGTLKNSKSLKITIFNPRAKGQAEAEGEDGQSSEASQDIFEETERITKSEGAKTVRTSSGEPVGTFSMPCTSTPSVPRQASVPGIHGTTSTADRQSPVPQCLNMYTAVSQHVYSYPGPLLQTAAQGQVQYPTSHLQSLSGRNWWSHNSSVLHSPTFAPQPVTHLANRQILYNQWQTY